MRTVSELNLTRHSRSFIASRTATGQSACCPCINVERQEASTRLSWSLRRAFLLEGHVLTAAQHAVVSKHFPNRIPQIRNTGYIRVLLLVYRPLGRSIRSGTNGKLQVQVVIELRCGANRLGAVHSDSAERGGCRQASRVHLCRYAQCASAWTTSAANVFRLH